MTIRPTTLMACATLLLCCALAGAAPVLVSKVPLPDPQVLQVDGEWFIFGTAAKPFLLYGDSLSPDRMRRKEIQLDYGAWTRPVLQVWGFTVFREDGGFHAYGTLHLGDYHTVVAHFLPAAGEKWTKGDPITKWKMTDVLLGDAATGEWCYEAKLVHEPDGPLFLVYCCDGGRNRNEIRAQRMIDAGHVDRRSMPQTLLRPDGYRSEDRNAPGGMQLVEGASFSRVGGKWVLLYSVGDYAQTTYKLGVAYSDQLIPPRGELYRKVLVADPNRIWGNEGRSDEVAYLLQSSHAKWPNYCGGSVAGPGLGSIVLDKDVPTLVFHGYKPDDSRRDPADRFVWQVPLKISISDDKPIQEWIRPVL